MKNNNLVKNIRNLLVFFILCFAAIIVYLTYFDMRIAENISDDPTNKRIRAEENMCLRGAIYDRNGDQIAYSQRTPDGKQKRFYKYGEEFAHITGYNSVVYGKSGIESAYNQELQGKGVSMDFLGSLFRSIRSGMNSEEKKGNNLILTVDSNVQKAAYDAMGDDKGGIAVMNPKTGEMLALVSKPSFDPGNIDNDFKELSTNDKDTPLLNRSTKGYYPPGSTFKIITASSALQNIPDVEEQTFNCKGKLSFGKYSLSDFNGEVHGRIKIDKAFKESCNFTFGTLGMQLGYTNLKNTAEGYMFNKNIETNDDHDSLHIKAGTISIADPKSRASLAQDAIGQNMVAANPMDMLLAASAVANNGNMMKPYIVKQIKDSYGNVIEEKKPQVLTNAITPEIANKLKGYMISVVKGGTGTKAKIKGITVAGKTGTAQDAAMGETHSWFVAFAPAENPQIAIAVIVENGGTGGTKAAGIARDVLKSYFKK